MWMSTLPSRYWYGTESHWGHFTSQTNMWAERGRALWLTLLIETYIFEIFTNRAVYKMYLIVLNVAVVMSLYYLVRTKRMLCLEL